MLKDMNNKKKILFGLLGGLVIAVGIFVVKGYYVPKQYLQNWEPIKIKVPEKIQPKEGTEEGIVFLTWYQDGNSIYLISSLYRMTLEDGIELLYESPQVPKVQIKDFDVTPDGEWVYFIENKAAQPGSNLYRMRTDGTGLTHLQDFSENIFEINIISDEEKIVTYGSLSNTDTHRVRVLDMDGNQSENLEIPGVALKLSPDNAWVMYAKEFQIEPDFYGAKVYLQDVDTGENRSLTGDEQMHQYSGSWSPDGKWLTFQSWENNNTDIYLVNLITGELTNMSDYPYDDRLVVWSPDSRYAAYLSMRYETRSAISLFLWDSVTGATIDLSRNLAQQTARVLSWSPDSDKVLVGAEHGKSTLLYLIDVKTQATSFFESEFFENDIFQFHHQHAYWGPILPLAEDAENSIPVSLVPVDIFDFVSQPTALVETVQLTASFDVNIRTGPGLDYGVVGTLEKGNTVAAVGKSWDGYWVQFEYPYSEDGLAWVYADLTNFIKFQPLPIISPPPVIILDD